jgi:hypothetical protein
MNATELRIKRKNTLAFIRAQPVSIVITRPTKTQNLRGGWDTEPRVLAPQTMRINHTLVGRRARQASPGNETFGDVPYSKDVLMGSWNADVQKDDVFVVDGVTYTVDYVFLNRDYETIANIQNTGQKADSG